MKPTTTTVPSKPLYLEDISIGMRFSTPRHPMDSAQIKDFAGNFDPQPFHLDEEAASASLFGGLAASGWHTAAVTMKLLVSSELRLSGGVIGAGVELNWPNPTRPNDVLQVRSEVVDITLSRSRPDRGIVTLICETHNQQNMVVQSMRAKIVVFRRGLPSLEKAKISLGGQHETT